MKAATHLAFAGFCGVLAQGLGLPLDLPGVAALAVGALLPDVDTTSSGLGKFVKPVSGLIERKFGHRTITHSFLGVALFALLGSPLWFYTQGAFWLLLIGLFSHLVLDTWNVIGVPFLYPSRLQFWFVRNRAYRLPYGSPLESTLLVTFFFVSIVLWPTSSEGFSPGFHRFMGTPSGVVADYLEWRDHFEVFAEVNGFNTETQEGIKGQYRVVDALGKEGVIVEDDAGDALAMGFVRGAQVTVYRTSATRGQPIQVKEYRLEVGGRSVADLLSSLPRAKRVWVTANLYFTQRLDAPPPVVGRYPRVRVFGKTLEVRSARPSDLEPLRELVIESGSAIVRAEYVKGEDTAASIELPAKAVKLRSLEIPNLPTMSGLIVKAGERVLEGQPIARYVNDSVLEAGRAAVEKAILTVKSSSAEIKSLRLTFTATKPALERKLLDATRTVSQLEYLVGAGAEPPVKLAQARANLRDLEAHRIESLSSFTSREAALERAVQGANLTVKGANATRNAALEKQWVRSPLAGLVSEVRVKSVTAKGITLEVVLLEEARKVGKTGRF